MPNLILLLSVSLLGLVNHATAQSPAPGTLASTAAGTYVVYKMISYSPTQEKKEMRMPIKSPGGDSLSAVVVAQAQSSHLLRLNFTQYHNQLVQLSFWIGDLIMKPADHTGYDLFLGETKMGHIEHKNISLDFRKDAAKATHIEAAKK